MTPDQYVDAIQALGFKTPNAAAPLLGVRRRTSARYASGERPVPGAVANFLNCLLKWHISGKEAIDDLGEDIFEISLKDD